MWRKRPHGEAQKCAPDASRSAYDGVRCVGFHHLSGSGRMCGIVGLYSKSPELERELGPYLAAMLSQMSDRGPDSAGVAVYRDPVPDGSSKLTLFSADPRMEWEALGRELALEFGGSPWPRPRANHAV